MLPKGQTVDNTFEFDNQGKPKVSTTMRKTRMTKLVDYDNQQSVHDKNIEAEEL